MNKNILFITMDCWSSFNSATTANTFASLFKNYDADRMASLYLREEIPTSKQCCRFFSISENAVLKSVFKPKTHTGKVFERENMTITPEDMRNIEQTKQRYGKLGVKRNKLLLLAREMMWLLGRWKSSEMNVFLDEFKPDVVIYGMEGYCFFHRIVRYVLDYTNAKGIGYFWDDNFTYIQHKKTPFFLIHRFMQRRSLKKTARKTANFFAISPKTKKEADEFFKINCSVLTKPIDAVQKSSSAVKTDIIKVVYTGNLKIGRLDTLKTISDVLDEEKVLSDRFVFDIYSGTTLDDRILSTLNPSIRFMGSIPAEKVDEVQKAADILLLMEDFQGENKRTARLSFSTKTTDYLGQGKCIFAIGHSDIATIEYFTQQGCAVCASSKEDIRAALLSLTQNPELIAIYGRKALHIGVSQHARAIMEERLYRAIGD